MEQNLRITDYFGCYVFGDDAMQKYMDATTYAELKEVIDKNRPLSSDLANRVADAMKEWALDNGATHYTHYRGKARRVHISRQERSRYTGIHGQDVV